LFLYREVKKKTVMPKGRPREFDADAALGKALEVFREKGYEGASLPDLTKAMGINRPSLYAAFGNKEALFRKALDRYAAERGCAMEATLAEPSARRAVERLLRESADALTAPRSPRGCLLVQGALSCGDDAGAVRDELASRRAAGVVTLRRRFERAVAEGDLPKDADAAALARFVSTVLQGMSVQAAGGATRAELRRVAETAMRAWPS
jgi:AcrR family transcriptional regulator